MIDDVFEARARFIAYLDIAGHVPDPLWRAAFEQVPRHPLLPRFFIPTPDDRWQAIDPAHPDYSTWVYADVVLATQLDRRTDPNPNGGPVAGVATSGSTQPGLMAHLLEALRVTGSERVLEIGTGTGYGTALLAHRLGDDHVTTIEIDPVIAYRARTRLATCGYLPTVLTDDGTRPQIGRHDRLIAACAVPTIPREWINQIDNGGLIVAGLWRGLGGGPMVRLEVNGGIAQGFFLPWAGGLMPVRSVTPPVSALATTRPAGDTRTATISSGMVSGGAAMWIALLVPRATSLCVTPIDGRPQFWLFGADGSWAVLDDSTMRVEQYGARRLWDEVELAHQQWVARGAPGRDRMGLTVTPDGTHRFWLDDPTDELWTDTPGRHPRQDP